MDFCFLSLLFLKFDGWSEQLLNFKFLVPIAILLNYIFDANLFDFQQLNYLFGSMSSQRITCEVFLELQFSFGNVRHFFSFYFFSVFHYFVDFQKIFLGMTADLGSCSIRDLILNFLPVLAVTNNGWDSDKNYHLKTWGALTDSIGLRSWRKHPSWRQGSFQTETR